MIGPEDNPADDEPIDREAFEAWAKEQPQAPSGLTDERAAFEKWAHDCGSQFFDRRSQGASRAGKYVDPYLEEEWSAWKARAALASAAPASDHAAQPDKPTAKALEFAEYMAKGADRVLDAVNAEFLAREAVEEFDEEGDGHAARFESLEMAADEASQACAEEMRGLRSDIYEFRKRAAKVAQPQQKGAE